MIGTGAAILGAAGIAGSLLGASKAAKAADRQGQLEYQASQDTIASNERLAAQAREDNAPARAIGNASLSAMGSAFGLPGYGAQPSMTGAPTYASTPVANPGISMTGKTAGGSAGVSPIEMSKGADGVYTTTAAAAPAAPAAGTPVPDVDAFLAANPDIATYYAQTPDAQKMSLQNFALDVAKQQADLRGAMPMKAAPYTAPAGYVDPTAPTGYASADRPAGYIAPARMTGPALDVSADAYHTSPGYTFQLEQGQRGLDHVASAGGGIMSGQRQKAALRFSQGLADQDYTDWRNYTTDQFNVDRSRGDSIYSEDNNFGYGQNRDQQSDFQTDRAFTTGRYDTRNNQLMTLAGFGANATAAGTSAATSFAQNSNAARMTGAQAQGNAAVGGANAYNGAINNLMTTGAYLYGKTL